MATDHFLFLARFTDGGHCYSLPRFCCLCCSVSCGWKVLLVSFRERRRAHGQTMESNFTQTFFVILHLYVLCPCLLILTIILRIIWCIATFSTYTGSVLAVLLNQVAILTFFASFSLVIFWQYVLIMSSMLYVTPIG